MDVYIKMFYLLQMHPAAGKPQEAVEQHANR